MQTNPYTTRVDYVEVDGKQIATDQEGYIQDMSEWSEGFASAIARNEGVTLTDEHWEVIHNIRDHHERHQVQAQVLDIIKHFKKKWGKERGNNKYLHELFPTGGGPQKQGNRMAGIRRTKGEH